VSQAWRVNSVKPPGQGIRIWNSLDIPHGLLPDAAMMDSTTEREKRAL